MPEGTEGCIQHKKTGLVAGGARERRLSTPCTSISDCLCVGLELLAEPQAPSLVYATRAPQSRLTLFERFEKRPDMYR